MKGTAPKIEVVTAGQIKELASTMTEAIPTDLPFDVAQRWIRNKRKLGEEIRGVLFGVQKVLSAMVGEWRSFYRDYFGINELFCDLRIPNSQPGFDRLILVAQGLTPNKAYDACAKHFPCRRYTNDLDAAVVQNERDPSKGSCAIWVRDRQEADEELRNFSADQVQQQGIKTMTLLERLLFELKYWDETKQHLDIQNITLCSGSRYSGGYVPCVSWDGGKLDVYWYDPRVASPVLRARAAVSL